MVIRLLFINIIGKAGIEYSIDTRFEKLSNMTVHYLCRIACSIRGNGKLSLFIGLS